MKLIVLFGLAAASEAWTPSLGRLRSRVRQQHAPARATGYRLAKVPAMGLLDNLFNDEETTALGKGVSVAKVQVALNSPNRGRNSIVGALEQKADSANTSTSRGLARLVSDVTLELLRRQVGQRSICARARFGLNR